MAKLVNVTPLISQESCNNVTFQNFYVKFNGIKLQENRFPKQVVQE